MPLKQSHAYLTRECYAIFDRLTLFIFDRLSLFREQRRHECELYFGIHDSFQFEPSLRQCSEVARSCLPVSLVAGSMAFTALLAAAMLEAGTCIDSEPSGSGSADSTRCIVPSFKIDFAPALAMRSIGHVPITKKFTENIFADSRKHAKFVQIFSLEKIPLYGILFHS